MRGVSQVGRDPFSHGHALFSQFCHSLIAEIGSYPDQGPGVLHHGSHVQTLGRILGMWEAEVGSERKESALKLLQLSLEEKAPALWTGKRVL